MHGSAVGVKPAAELTPSQQLGQGLYCNNGDARRS